MLGDMCLGMFAKRCKARLSLPQLLLKMIFMCNLSGDEWDEERGTVRTVRWANAIDRGGLWHVNDSTYSVL